MATILCVAYARDFSRKASPSVAKADGFDKKKRQFKFVRAVQPYNTP